MSTSHSEGNLFYVGVGGPSVESLGDRFYLRKCLKPNNAELCAALITIGSDPADDPKRSIDFPNWA